MSKKKCSFYFYNIITKKFHEGQYFRPLNVVLYTD